MYAILRKIRFTAQVFLNAYGPRSRLSAVALCISRKWKHVRRGNIRNDPGRFGLERISKSEHPGLHTHRTPQRPVSRVPRVFVFLPRNSCRVAVPLDSKVLNSHQRDTMMSRPSRKHDKIAFNLKCEV